MGAYVNPLAYYDTPNTPYIPTTPQGLAFQNTDDPRRTLMNERSRAWWQGDVNEQEFRDYGLPYRGQEQRYQRLADEAYLPFLTGGGGYDPETEARLRDSQRLNQLEMSPEEWENRFFSENEQADIYGDPYSGFDYYDPYRFDEINRNAAQGQFGAIDYGAGRMEGALGAGAGKIRDLYGSGELSLDADFGDTYPMSEADVDAYGYLGGRIAGERYKGMLEDIKRRTAGAGSAAFAQAGLQNRYARQGNIAAADSAVRAQLDAEALRREQMRQAEDMRLGAEQYQTGLGLSAEDRLLAQELGIHGEILGQELGAQRDVANRGIGTEQYLQDTAIGLEQRGEGMASQRSQDLAANRQGTEIGAQQDRFNRGAYTSEQRYGRERDIAGQRRADEQEGRGYLTGQMEYQGSRFGQEADRRASREDATGRRSLGAAGTAADYDIGRKQAGSFFKREVLPWVQTATNVGKTAGIFGHGGVFTQPTTVTVGEAGPEAVVPLDGQPTSPAVRSAMNRYGQRKKPNIGNVRNPYTETPDRRYAA